MHNKKIAVVVMMLPIMLCACDPRVSSDAVNPDLPAVTFAFNVSPSSKWINKGDTVEINSSASKAFPGNIILSDGYARIDATISYTLIPYLH